MQRAAVVVLLGCSAPAKPIDRPPPCEGVDVAVTPPSGSDPRATLEGSFAGDGMGIRAKTVCVSANGPPQRFEHDFRVDVRADPRELQRITIDGIPIVMHVPPHETVRVMYHPCANWQLSAAWLDAGTADDGIVRKRREGCPPDHVASDVHEAMYCAQVEGECPYIRCLPAARLELAATARQSVRLVDDDGTEHEVLAPGGSLLVGPYGGFCPNFESLATKTERVRIAPGLGEHWQLDVGADGHIVGVIR